MVRVPDLSEVECPFVRIEVTFLFTQLKKELGVHMDLKISYDDPTAILFPGWNLCSRMVFRRVEGNKLLTPTVENI